MPPPAQSPLILAIDQGTTSTRAILFNQQHRPVAIARRQLQQQYLRSGWVEHNPEQIWQDTLSTCSEALQKANAQPADIAAIGITNQRQTTVVWDRQTGQPLHNAIVWQDRRTAPQCEQIRSQGGEERIHAITGLLCDPYFSATKIAWILDNVPNARRKAEQGKLAAGTIDSFLLWRLTEGRTHATDATNASCTMLYDIHRGQWSDELMQQFQVPPDMLPEVHDCTADFGATRLLGGSIPIAGIAGDQQAALIGQACFEPGMMKATYGTGCFALINTGQQPVNSTSRLLTAIAYRMDGRTAYALEGSIFIAGAAVQWLQEGLGIIKSPEDAERLAQQADTQSGVFLVPAFVGLGAPYWDSECRGAMHGLTRSTTAAEIAKAALEAVAWQTRDLMEAIRSDWPEARSAVLRVDGGMAASDWLMQQLADVLQTTVDRPQELETTALGAAYLAGRQAGIYPAPPEFAAEWHLSRRFHPRQPQDQRYAAWRNAVRRTLTNPNG